MNRSHRYHSPFIRTLSLPLLIGLMAGVAATASGQVILNEYNAVRPQQLLESGGSDTYFGQVEGNGGDWFELVVVGDGTAGSTVDMRGWQIEMTLNRVIDFLDAGTLILSDDPFWSSVQAGTILTFTEGNSSAINPEVANVPFGLNTQINAVDNFATLGFGWSNLYVGDSQYFDLGSGSSTEIMGVHTGVENDKETNDDLWFRIFDGDPNQGATNILGGYVGENVTGYPGNRGVNGGEVFQLETNPSTSLAITDYTDSTDSSFGVPNPIGGGLVQDFTVFRVGVLGLVWDDATVVGLQEGGAGTWSNGGAGWFDTDSDTNVNWSNANPDSAVFGAGGSGTATVNLGTPITVDNLTFDPGTTYTLTGGPLTVNGYVLVINNATINSDVTFVDQGGKDSEILTGPQSTLTLNGQLLGNDGFDINGSGTIELTGNNSAYTGGIDVNQTATLRVIGSVHDTFGGLIDVEDNATLDIKSTGTVGNVLVDSGSGVEITGTGTIAGSLTMTDGSAKLAGSLDIDGPATIVRSTISPSDGNTGNTAGQINFNNGLTLGSNADLTWQLFSNTTTGAGINFDYLNVVGDVNEDGSNPLSGGGRFNVDVEMRDAVDLADSFWNSARQWTLISATGDFNPTADMFRIREALDNDNDAHPYTFGFSLDVVSNELVLNFNPNASRILIWDADTSPFPGLGATPTDGSGTWINGSNNWSIKTANLGWDSSRPDFAIFGSDAANQEGGPTFTITVDNSQGQVVARGIQIENNNGFYNFTGGEIHVQDIIRAKLSSTFDNDVTFVDPTGTGTKTLVDVGGGDSVTFNGQLAGEGMRIDSRGEVVINSNNTGYAGDIDLIDRPILRVEGHSGTGTISALQGQVANAELTGNGTVGGNLVFTDGDAKVSGNLTVVGDALVSRSVLSPGDANAAGNLAFQGDLTLGERADYTWQLFGQVDNSNGTAGTDFDQITVTGNVAADASLIAGEEVVIDVELRGAGIDLTDDFWFYNGPRTWTIIDAGSISVAQSLFTIGDVLDADDNPLAVGLAAGFRLEVNGGDLDLIYDGPLPGDANLDGTVSIADFAALQNNFGQSGEWADGDFNGDGVVSIADFALLQNNFGAGGASVTAAELAAVEAFASAIPEPGSLVLLSLGGGLLLMRRRNN